MWTNILLVFIVLLLTIILYVLSHLARLLQRIPDGNLREIHEKFHATSRRPKKNAYAKNGISEALAKELKDKMLIKMKEDEPYLNPDFNVGDLGRMLSLSKHQTSLILNKELKMDFYSFINSLRVNRAKQLLLDGDAQIGEVLFDVGFNNSATFNRAFKKQTGMTPRQYMSHFQKDMGIARAAQ